MPRQRNTSICINDLIHIIRNHHNHERRTQLITIDLEAAYENASINLVVEKLLEFGAPEQVIMWVSDFLSNRELHFGSNKFKVNNGLPQGSTSYDIEHVELLTFFETCRN